MFILLVMGWIPLHLHSQYSVLEATIAIDAIVAKAKEYNLKAIALTDMGNMFGAVDFYKACKAEKIKPIIGCEMWLAPASHTHKKKVSGQPNGYPVTLLAKNDTGYKNLCRLSSLGYVEGFYYYPRIDKELLKKYGEGLVCLSGGLKGSVGSFILEEKESYLEEIKWFKDLFLEDYYFELQRHQMSPELVAGEMGKESWLFQEYETFIKNEKRLVEALLKVSSDLSIKCVATNEIRYLERDDWKAHEILLNIQSGEPVEMWERDLRGNPVSRILNPKRKVCPSHEFYFKSPAEMEAVFQDIPESIQNTSEVAEKCDFHFDFKTKHYPVFYPPNLKEGQDRDKEAKNYLLKLSEDAIERRYPQEALEKVREKYPDKDPLETVKDRLKYEFEIISSKGMCDYILIVYDFIAWAKSKNIPVGPGRGSAVGSIISYLIGITNIEPLRFNLFFERFINPERVSYPDIDVDICMERRGEVINYTVEKYGKDRVAQIITFGTMKAKMALRDVGRVLSVPLSKINAVAKLVPEEIGMTLEKALAADSELKSIYETDSEIRMVIDAAKKIEGSIRNTGIHAAGLIISEEPLLEHMPVCTAKDSEMLVTQYAMKPAEMIGMLKIDFLGLKTLTSLKKVSSLVGKEWSTLPLDDKKTFDFINLGKTLGIFQIESGGMRDLVQNLHIDCFEEIMAVNALYRPGPMEMIPSFIGRKHGRESNEIDHPWMKEILEETYGVMVYQEQVMQIASRLASYSLGEGDVLRKAMGKKDRAEMQRQKEKFVEGALKNGISQELSEHIFEKIEKFASYGFNKSHAAAYAYIIYATAYFKANHPKEWMAALLTSDLSDIDKVAELILECKSLGIAILPPDINVSGIDFAPVAEGIRFAITAIKGIGSGVVEAIESERKKGGRFKSLYDFIKRVDLSKVGKKNIELLIDAGSFDFTGISRDDMKYNLESTYTEAARRRKEDEAGVINFFSMMEEDEPPFVTCPTPLSDLDLLKKEKALLGFYLTAHPLERCKEILSKFSCLTLSELKTHESGTFPVGFIVDAVDIKISKMQKKFAILAVSDFTEKLELPVWADLYEKRGALIEENRILYALIQIEKRDGAVKFQTRFLADLSDEASIGEGGGMQRAKKVESVEKKVFTLSEMELDIEEISLSKILDIKKIFRDFPGSSKIKLSFFHQGKRSHTLTIDPRWSVKMCKEVEDRLKSIKGILSIKT